MASLQQELQRLSYPGPLSRQVAESFLFAFPLQDIGTAVATGEVDVNQLAAVLEKVLSNSTLPPDALYSYAFMALEAPAPELRRLAVKQLCHLVKGNLDVSSSQRQDTVVRLVRCIGDCDVSVSTKASQALVETASLTQGLQVVLGTSEQEQALSELTSSSNPTVRLRALSFVISLAGNSPAAAAAVRERGYLEPLAKEVGSSDDILGCVAALELVTQLAQQAGPAATQLLGSSLVPNLVRLARSSDNSLLKGRALRALGSVLAASTAAGADDPLVFSDSRQTLSSVVLGFMELVLSPTSEAEIDEPGSKRALPLGCLAKGLLAACFPSQAEAQSAAFEVVEEVSASRSGATLLATHRSLPEAIAERALAATGKSGSQIAALHALADLLGASRAEEDRSSAAALLGVGPEARLRDSLYRAAGRGSPCEILWSRLRQPFSEHRIAAYRGVESIQESRRAVQRARALQHVGERRGWVPGHCVPADALLTQLVGCGRPNVRTVVLALFWDWRLLAAIAMREWGAREACSHTALLSHLCDPRSESGEDPSRWRFACTQRLVKTAETAISGGGLSQQDILRAAYPRLSEAALQGPYGAGVIRPPIVATEMG